MACVVGNSAACVLPLPERTWIVLLDHQQAQGRERQRLREVWPHHGPANCPDVRLHDLGHTVVSLLMEMGVPPDIVRAIAHHADGRLPAGAGQGCGRGWFRTSDASLLRSARAIPRRPATSLTSNDRPSLTAVAC